MNKEDLFIINVGRQLGSGGHIIGRQLAKDFNIRFYDKELLDLAAQESGFNKKFFERNDEHKGFFKLLLSSFAPIFSNSENIYNNQLSDESLFKFQSDAIRKVAIAMYEGEINMVIHADGGTITVSVSDKDITMVLADHGPGIPDIDKAMEEGYSTARDEVRSLGFGAGMGLPNMKRFTDEMKIETVIGQGTTITMKVNL